MKVKVHRAYRTVVAICDSDLIGKLFEEGIKQLNVRENFYNGEDMEEEQVIELMQDMAREDATFNIVGDEACKAALKIGLIDKKGIKKIQNIPFALVLL